jgi:hypothetical protein
MALFTHLHIHGNVPFPANLVGLNAFTLQLSQIAWTKSANGRSTQPTVGVGWDRF